MNKKLVFSWGHILALLALIAFSYVAFVGFSYYTGGRFLLSGLLVAGIDVLLLLTFVLAQQLKIWDGPFRNYIIVERLLLLMMAPLAVVVAMFPVNHWLGLREHQHVMASDFTAAIDSAKVMFTDYETYAAQRINHLGDDIYRQQRRTATSDLLGGESADLKAERELTRANTMRALRLMLVSDNYVGVRDAARQWMDETAAEPSMLNVFLMANIDEIQTAMQSWNQQLADFSAKRLSAEGKGDVPAFSNRNSHVEQADVMLENLKDMFRLQQPLSGTTPWAALALFLMMMVPWWVQRRNTKSTYRLFGHEGATPLDRLFNRGSGKQNRARTFQSEEHDYQRHVRKF